MEQAPVWILRHHSGEAIHSLRVFTEKQKGIGVNELVLAGDAAGRISVTSLKTYRQTYFWKAHKASILGLDLIKYDDRMCVISQGRDNKLRIFAIQEAQKSLTSGAAVLPSRITSDRPIPDCKITLDINSLNFCSFSNVPAEEITDEKDGFFIALPHTVDSAYIDIFHLPSKRRFARAIGKADLSTSGVKAIRQAIVMSVKIFYRFNKLFILAAYEDGLVKLWLVKHDQLTNTEEGEETWPFELMWSERKHLESALALALSSEFDFAVSIGADNRLVRYELFPEKDQERVQVTSTKDVGHASIAISQDEQVVAVGGWDGRVRLYNTSSLKLTTTLRYHKDTVQALAFNQHRKVTDEILSESSGESEGEQEGGKLSFLATGGKEGRICLYRV